MSSEGLLSETAGLSVLESGLELTSAARAICILCVSVVLTQPVLECSPCG